MKISAILLSLLLYGQIAFAQLCQGSLGDPIVNITFGSGSNPAPALSAATTFYQYVSSDCPQDGFYTVRNNTTACFGTSWHTLAGDHTAEPFGYFMLVNASFQPSDFYIDTVRGLCGNTTYEFAAWVMNVLLPGSCNNMGIQPDLTFSIERTDGTILQSYNSNNIPSTAIPTWKQHGFFFTTPPAGSDIVLRIRNKAVGGCGNDLALDDITFRPCGPQITNSIDGVPAAPASYCEGPLKQYRFSCTVSGGFINPSFIWQVRTPANNVWTDVPTETTNAINFVIPANAPPGTYQARLAVAEAGNLGSPQCRIYSAPFTVVVNANPVTTVVNDGPVCVNQTITLTATGGAQYAWSGPNASTGSGSALALANVQLNQAGKYYVTVTNAAGCTHLDSTSIIVNPAPIADANPANSTICLEDSLQLTATGGISYQWIPATGLSDATIFNPKVSPAISTTYDVIVSNQFGCKDTASVNLQVLNPPIANAGSDRTILEGQSIQLQGSVNETGNNISWSPATYIDDVNILEPTVNPPVDTKYILSVVSNFGCGTSTDTMLVKVYKNIFIPSAFSPNGDGRNDTWNIPALAAYPFFEIAVFSRWGQLVFRSKNTLKPWDGTLNGKPLPIGSYNYFINVGRSQDLFRGSVMIIR